MSFVDETQAWIRRIPPQSEVFVGLDMARVRAAVFQALEAAERDGRDVAEAVGWWLHPGRVEAFAAEVVRLLAAEVPVAWTSARAQPVVEGAALILIGGESPVEPFGTGSRVARLRFADLAKRASHATGVPAPSNLAYMLAIDLVRLDHGVPVRLEAGRILAECSPADARRWLLHLEVQQSHGPWDRSRIHRSVPAALLRGAIEYDVHPTCEADVPWCAREQLDRLVALGVTTCDDEPGTWLVCYTIAPEGRSLVEELVADPPGPFARLAEAVLGGHPMPIPASRGWGQDSDSVGRSLEAHSVAHHVRNAAGAALTNLSMLVGDVRAGRPLPEAPARRLERQLHQLLAFADDHVRAAELGLGDTTPYSLAAAVQGALDQTVAERNGRVLVTVTALPDALVPGPRVLLERALIEILRNAAQLPGPSVQVQLHTEQGEAQLALHVDDDGPGIPASQRDHVFDRGFSRREGGQGVGLFVARESISRLRGSLTCSASPSGGARFTVALPCPPRIA